LEPVPPPPADALFATTETQTSILSSPPHVVPMPREEFERDGNVKFNWYNPGNPLPTPA
jgi:hypothetical protein